MQRNARINTDILEYDTNQFFAAYKIHNPSTGIFVRLIVEFAGISTKPESISSEYGHLFCIKGLSRSDSQQFIQFFKNNGDQHARCNYHGEEDPDEYHFVFTSPEINYNIMLPLVKWKFQKLLESKPEIIAKYQADSKKYFPDDPTPLQILTRQAETAYMERVRSTQSDENANKVSIKASIDIFPELINFLKPFQINPSRCDVFEETILKMADISTQPTRCSFVCCHAPFYGPSFSFGMDPAATGRIAFSIAGLSTDDAVKLTRYFIAQGDATVRCREPVNDTDCYTFNVDAAALYNAILPQFKHYIEQAASENTESLRRYQELCKKDFEKSEPEPVSEDLLLKPASPEPTVCGSVYRFFKRLVNSDEDTSENDKLKKCKLG